MQCSGYICRDGCPGGDKTRYRKGYGARYRDGDKARCKEGYGERYGGGDGEGNGEGNGEGDGERYGEGYGTGLDRGALPFSAESGEKYGDVIAGGDGCAQLFEKRAEGL